MVELFSFMALLFSSVAATLQCHSVELGQEWGTATSPVPLVLLLDIKDINGCFFISRETHVGDSSSGAVDCKNNAVDVLLDII